MRQLRICLAIIGLFYGTQCSAQQPRSSSPDSLVSANFISPKYFTDVAAKAKKMVLHLEDRQAKALTELAKQEARIKSALEKIDPSKATELFNEPAISSEVINQKVNAAKDLAYVSSLDTLITSLKFIKGSLTSASLAGNQSKIANALQKTQVLQEKFNQAAKLQELLKARRGLLVSRLQGLPMAKEVIKINKQAYYYAAQVNEYKDLLHDHTKAEKKALALLMRANGFQNFLRKNSVLASFFRPQTDPMANSAVAFAGLQTRLQVSGVLQQQFGDGTSVQAQVGQAIQDGQQQFQQIKAKAAEQGAEGSEDIMPQGFRPNNQKKHSFLKRLELGTNFQSQRSNGLFPTTSDLGVSLGYKLNDQSIIGAGASYKIGWGRNIQRIHITHQGIGLRSFIDWKLKGALFITGGYELNYRSEFRKLAELKDVSAWQQSGLIGLSKTVAIKSKILSKTKVQVLWDFLSYSQVPVTQPIVFRIGYTFK